MSSSKRPSYSYDGRPHPRRDSLPDQIQMLGEQALQLQNGVHYHPTGVLNLLGQTNVVALDTLAGLVGQTDPWFLPAHELLRFERKIDRLQGKGFVEVWDEPIDYLNMRRNVRDLYRITEDGTKTLRYLVQNGARSNSVKLRVLRFLRKYGCHDPDGWVGEDSLIWGPFRSWSSGRAKVRQRLRKLEDEGILDHRHRYPEFKERVVQLTNRGRNRLLKWLAQKGRSEFQLTREPDAVDHHLMTLAGVVRFLRFLRKQDARLVTFVGDEDLRSRTRSGTTLTRGMSTDHLPDGELVYVRKHGGKLVLQKKRFEVLIGKYSTQAIRQKGELPGVEHLQLVAPTESCCLRVNEELGRLPMLLGPFGQVLSLRQEAA